MLNKSIVYISFTETSVHADLSYNWKRHFISITLEMNDILLMCVMLECI